MLCFQINCDCILYNNDTGEYIMWDTIMGISDHCFYHKIMQVAFSRIHVTYFSHLDSALDEEHAQQQAYTVRPSTTPRQHEHVIKPVEYYNTFFRKSASKVCDEEYNKPDPFETC